MFLTNRNFIRIVTDIREQTTKSPHDAQDITTFQ
ncbi:hypothetical protein CARUB_v10007377mg, partial [Capsella rubella]